MTGIFLCNSGKEICYVPIGEEGRITTFVYDQHIHRLQMIFRDGHIEIVKDTAIGAMHEQLTTQHHILVSPVSDDDSLQDEYIAELTQK